MKLLFRWINKLLCGWNVGLYFRPRIRYEGKKCLPAFTRGPAIIITNHKNQMDFLLVLYLFYFRYVRCLVGKTFYECNRFLNWCLRMLGAIKVDRFSFGMDFFCESVEALRRGQLLLIFRRGASPRREKFWNSAVRRPCLRCRPMCPSSHVALRELWLRQTHGRRHRRTDPPFGAVLYGQSGRGGA